MTMAPAISPRLLATLSALLPVATRTFRDPWWVIGSVAMQLGGIARIEPNDVDLMCSAGDADRLIAAWREHLDTACRSRDEGRFRSRFARFRHLPMPLEVMGDLQVGNGAEWVPVRVETSRRVPLAGFAVPIPALPDQLRVLRQFGRGKDLAKAGLISSHLEAEFANAG